MTGQQRLSVESLLDGGRRPRSHRLTGLWLRLQGTLGFGRSTSREEFASPDVTDSVMARLPELDPISLRRLAAVVVEAWEDPELRERLRRAPRPVLADSGIAVPSHVRVEVGREDNAPMPNAERLHLPLPAQGARAFSAAEARGRLARVGWHQLVGAPAVTPLGSGRARSVQVPNIIASARPSWRRSTGGWRAPAALSATAAAIALALALSALDIGGSGGGALDGGEHLAGRAVLDPATMAWAFAGVALALALLAVQRHHR